jgi:hypothetical protein
VPKSEKTKQNNSGPYNPLTKNRYPNGSLVVTFEQVWTFGAEDITSSADCQTAATDGEGNWQPGETYLTEQVMSRKFCMFFS